MEVVIKPNHLKGNSWMHYENPEKRPCPLHEALIVAGYDVGFVGASYFTLKVNGSLKRDFYDIVSETWNLDIAKDAIKAANNGSQKEFTVKFVNHA